MWFGCLEEPSQTAWAYGYVNLGEEKEVIIHCINELKITVFVEQPLVLLGSVKKLQQGEKYIFFIVGKANVSVIFDTTVTTQ